MSNKNFPRFKIKLDTKSSFLTKMIINHAISIGYSMYEGYKVFSEQNPKHIFRHFYLTSDGIVHCDDFNSDDNFLRHKCYNEISLDSFMDITKVSSPKKLNRYRLYRKNGRVYETSDFLQIRDDFEDNVNVFYDGSGETITLSDDIIKFEPIEPSIYV